MLLFEGIDYGNHQNSRSCEISERIYEESRNFIVMCVWLINMEVFIMKLIMNTWWNNWYFEVNFKISIEFYRKTFLKVYGNIGKFIKFFLNSSTLLLYKITHFLFLLVYFKSQYCMTLMILFFCFKSKVLHDKYFNFRILENIQDPFKLSKNMYVKL